MKSLWIKAGLQQWKNEKDQIFIEREELYPTITLSGKKRKKIKDFPEFSENRGITSYRAQ